ncbi:MAG: hypothetical protein V4538_02410 [Bacteroidota bacterium]
MSTKAVVYIKDIAKITGKSYPASQRELSRLKTQLKIEKGQYLSLSAYCKATGISINDAISALNAKN